MIVEVVIEGSAETGFGVDDVENKLKENGVQFMNIP